MANPQVNRLTDGQEILHVAINPPGAADANLIKETAAIIDKDLNATNQLLVGNIPRIIAHYQTAQAAEQAAEHLRKLGLTVIICGDTELRRSSPPIFKARTLKSSPRELIFQDKNSTVKTIKIEDVFLIIKGRAHVQSDKTVTTTKRKLNLAATLMTGGLPIMSKVEQKSVETSLQSEYFLRLYHRKSPVPDIEITQHGFDYSCLGKDMSATTLANFNTLSDKIKGLCPGSAFDDRLAQSPSPGTSLITPGSNYESQCKLIYWFQEAANK
jgi:hypothetical protein